MPKAADRDKTPTAGPKLWVVLARAYGAMAAYVESCIAAEGLCLSDFAVLEVLLHKGPMTISAIGDKVLLANASMTSAVDRLEHRGLVLRRSPEGDRRVRIVELTEPGRTSITALYARHAHAIEQVTGALGAKEREQLRRSLKKLGLAAKQANTPPVTQPADGAATSPAETDTAVTATQSKRTRKRRESQ